MEPRPALFNQDDLIELRTGKGNRGSGFPYCRYWGKHPHAKALMLKTGDGRTETGERRRENKEGRRGEDEKKCGFCLTAAFFKGSI